MICPKCSHVMSEGSRFCDACGAKLEETGTGQTEQGSFAEAGSSTPGANMTGQAVPVGETVVKKGISKPVLFGLIGGGIFFVAAMITLLIVFLLMDNKTQFNLRDYTEVKFEGVEGNGTATAELDNARLLEDMARSRDVDVDRIKNLEANFDDLDEMLSNNDVQKVLEMYSAMQGIQVDLDQSEGLSNGDTVVVSYTINQEKADIAKVEFIGEPITKTVSGLNEVEEIDPFEGLSISFEGTSPNAYVVFQNDNKNEAASRVWFEADRSNGLKLGDTIRVSVKGYDEDEFIKSYGVRFSQTEKEYKVEGVEGYITENQDLDPEALDVMMAATEDYIKGYLDDKSRADAIKADELKYEGYYLLTNKSSDVWYGVNKVYIVYSATVRSKEKKKQFKPTKVYFPVEYDDIKVNANGSYDINTNYKNILGSTNLNFGFWETVNGYTSKEDMKEELVDADGLDYIGKAYGELE